MTAVNRAKALRDAEAALVQRRLRGQLELSTETEVVIDAVLALVPSGGGLTLTREEARIARKALLAYGVEPHFLDYDDEDEMGALVKRLEAAS